MIEWIKNNWFELITAIVAIVALVLPWITKIIQTKKSKLEILPNRRINIGFNKRGVYIITYAAILSKHMESVLSSMRIRVLKDRNCIYNLESDMFLNPYVQSYYTQEQSINKVLSQ